jgi:hypothetical protein
MHEELESFSRPGETGELRGRFLEDRLKRVRSGLKVAYDKSRFDQWICDLRESNTDLRLLREQIGELTKSRPKTVAALSRRRASNKQLPPEFRSYGATQRALKALYDALNIAWSKGDATQFKHIVRIFLDTKAENDVQMSIIISCLGRNIIKQSMLMIHVRSQTLDCMDTNSVSATHHIPVLDPEDTVPKPKRAGVVRFLDDESLERSSATVQTSTRGAIDLRASQHFCSDLALSHIPQRHQAATGESCVGFLDTCSHEKFRHMFFCCHEGVCNPAICQGGFMSEPGGLRRLDDILAQPRSGELFVQHQLQLALSLVSAVLKFNSTPWLDEHWGLRDV